MQDLRNGELGTRRSGGLPPEIMAQIFALCRRSPETRSMISPHLLPPYTLSQVCQYWRTICIDTAELWSDIVTGYYGFRPAKAAEFIQEWARRAEGCPLSVRHSPDLFSGMHLMVEKSANAKYVQDSRALTSVISVLASRLRKLELSVVESVTLSPILFLLGTGLWTPGSPSSSSSDDDDSASSYSELDFTVSFPILESLQIKSSQLSPLSNAALPRDRLLTSLHSTCPVLRSIHLQWPGVSLGPTTQVLRFMRSLDLEYCSSAEQALRWVDICPNLARLTVSVFGSDGDEADEFEPEIDDEEIDDFDGLEDELDEHPISAASGYDPEYPLEYQQYGEHDGLGDGDDDMQDGDNGLDVESFERMSLYGSDGGTSIAESVTPHLAEKSTRKPAELRHLELTGYSALSDLQNILRVIECPALRTLHISTYSVFRTGGRWISLIEFLVRSGCASKLQDFRASGTPMQPEDVRECLIMMGNLKKLKLERLIDADGVLRFLTIPRRSDKHRGGEIELGRRRRTESDSDARQINLNITSVWGEAHLCPKLEVLDLSETTFSVDVLAEMIHSRCNSKDYGPDFPGRQPRFGFVKVDRQFLRTIRKHPKVTGYVTSGLLKIREGEGNVCLNVWGP